MDDIQTSEESTEFVTEEIERIVNAVVETYLKDLNYDESKVGQWVNQICEGCMRKFTDLRKPFKYILSCVIMQKNGAGIHSATSCYWDTVTDGVMTVRWPGEKGRGGGKEQTKDITCIVTVFGLGL